MTADLDHGTAPRVVVFDIGEVLIDETRVWSTWAEILGVSPLTFHAVLGAAVAQGLDHHEVFAHIAPNVAWRELENEHEQRYGGFTEADLYGDVRPTLTALHSAGFGIVIAGNQPARRQAQLEALALGQDAMAMSEALGAEKPAPGFYDAVLDLVGGLTPADGLYVGDRIDNDVLPAAAAGLRTCWLRRGPWGQLQEMPDDHEPDLVLDGLGELPTLLETWRDG